MQVTSQPACTIADWPMAEWPTNRMAYRALVPRGGSAGALNTFTKLVPEKHRKLLNVPISPVGTLCVCGGGGAAQCFQLWEVW